MGKREKIRKIYQKNKIQVNDDYIENSMKDKERVKAFMRLYKKEEIDSMNYVLGKNKDNKKFTKFELEALSKIDLFNPSVIAIARRIYEREVIAQCKI